MNTTIQQLRSQLHRELDKVLFGIAHLHDILTIAIIAGGNILVSGVPGSGKTLLSKSVLQLLGHEVARVDCGNDIEFTNILHALSAPAKGGPTSAANLYLSGLNRLTPNTQAILLPVMEEHQLINNGQVLHLHPAFRVMASYDPTCYDDTYPLLYAMLDRFYICLPLTMLAAEQETALLKNRDYPLTEPTGKPVSEISALNPAHVIEARETAQAVSVADAVYDYVIRIMQGIRRHPDLQGAVSPRAALSVINAARIHAAIQTREAVGLEDIRIVLPYCLLHRMQLNSDAMINGRLTADILAEVLTATRVSASAAD